MFIGHHHKSCKSSLRNGPRNGPAEWDAGCFSYARHKPMANKAGEWLVASLSECLYCSHSLQPTLLISSLSFVCSRVVPQKLHLRRDKSENQMTSRDPRLACSPSAPARQAFPLPPSHLGSRTGATMCTCGTVVSALFLLFLLSAQLLSFLLLYQIIVR